MPLKSLPPTMKTFTQLPGVHGKCVAHSSFQSSSPFYPESANHPTIICRPSPLNQWHPQPTSNPCQRIPQEEATYCRRPDVRRPNQPTISGFRFLHYMFNLRFKMSDWINVESFQGRRMGNDWKLQVRPLRSTKMKKPKGEDWMK